MAGSGSEEGEGDDVDAVGAGVGLGSGGDDGEGGVVVGGECVAQPVEVFPVVLWAGAIA